MTSPPSMASLRLGEPDAPELGIDEERGVDAEVARAPNRLGDLR